MIGRRRYDGGTGFAGRVAVGVAALVVALSWGHTASAQPAAQQPTTPAQAISAVQEVVDAFATDATRLRDELHRTESVIRNTSSLDDAEVLAIAEGNPKVEDWIADHPVTRTTPSYDREKDQHTVWFVAKRDDGKEVTEAQIIIDDESGEITEVRTGPQVAWMMARGYDGSFGRALNRPVVWLTFCALFLVPLIDPRRIASFRTLDLLALLSFSLSLIWFNRGEIFTSVPLVYPPMVYLLARLVWIGLARGRGPDGPAMPPRSRPDFPGWAPTWLLTTALAVAAGLRYGLNAFNANVIDVGYAGVIGADRIMHGMTPYGTFPSDCARCDTYGPFTYITYIPFEAVMPWEGRWNALPAAHGAATMFDLACVAGLVLLGRRAGDWRLGLALGLAWMAHPFTAYSLESNSNDSLVAAALIWGLALMFTPMMRGLALGLAVAAKFGPAILVFLWWRRPFPRRGAPDEPWRFLGGVALAAVLTGWVLLLDGDDGIRAFWSRTIGYQLDRDSPFSIWGQHPGLRPLQLALTVGVAVAAVALARWPRRLDVLSFTALSGALMVGTQLTLTHWFYLYIPWFLPFALVAMVPRWPGARPAETTPATPSPPREPHTSTTAATP
ncbi:MAG: DUF2029 domain-containing protein [Actinobacteria bacterium]|nr:DUF2029 domain-containing protein [Thermoleophilia bacterium]MCB9011450.1 DUF2029 domain-containing protein [Actinomycetota bacterium]